MQAHTLWYTRQGGNVRGPFPTAVIGQYLLLGRLTKEDEVSIDQHSWQPIAEYEELIPEVMKADLTEPYNQQLLEIEKRRADERLALDRRQGLAGRAEEHRGGERRAEEPDDLLSYRKTKTKVIVRGREMRYANKTLAMTIIFSVIGVLVAVIMMYTPQPSGPDMDCSATPAPDVNWSNCQLQGLVLDAQDLHGALIRNADLSGSSLQASNLSGVDLAFSNLTRSNFQQANLSNASLMGANLRGSDLRGANLRGADLSYANLQGASLSGMKMDGVKLDQTVWNDNSVCANGSMGQCLPIKK